MFWRKKDKPLLRPIGVKLDIDINMSSLNPILKSQELVSIDDMCEKWASYNCVKTNISIVAINTIHDHIIFMQGTDGNIYRDLEFDIKLPFSTGKDKVDHIEVRSLDGFIYFYFDDIAIMAIPTIYVAELLLGRPLANFKNAIDDRFGKEVASCVGTSNEKVPAIVTLAVDHFSLKNTAIKISSYPIEPSTEYPISLGERE